MEYALRDLDFLNILFPWIGVTQWPNGLVTLVYGFEGIDTVLVVGCRVMTSLDMLYSLTGKLLRCDVGAVGLRRQ